MSGNGWRGDSGVASCLLSEKVLQLAGMHRLHKDTHGYEPRIYKRRKQLKEQNESPDDKNKGE